MSSFLFCKVDAIASGNDIISGSELWLCLIVSETSRLSLSFMSGKEGSPAKPPYKMSCISICLLTSSAPIFQLLFVVLGAMMEAQPHTNGSEQ